MIDKTTVKAVGGSSGGGSSTGSVGSSAVISKGGGQTGGGYLHQKSMVTDMSRAIKRNVWQMPFVVPKGTNYGDAVKAMVLDRLPSQTEFAISTTTRVLSTAVGVRHGSGWDPWQDIREVAQAIDTMFLDAAWGVCVPAGAGSAYRRAGVHVDENFNPSSLRRLKSFRTSRRSTTSCHRPVFEFAEPGQRGSRSTTTRPVVLTSWAIMAGSLNA